MKEYLVVYRLEDDVHIDLYSANSLAEFLREDGFGLEFIQSTDAVPTYFDDFPSNTCLIMKGSIVVPKPKTVVQEWSF